MRVRVHHTAHHLTKFKFDCHAPCASSVVPGSNPALRALSQIRCIVFDASRFKLRRFRCWYRVDFRFILLLLLFHANRQRIPRQNKTVNKYVNQYNWLAITIIHDIGDAYSVSISISFSSERREGDCINAITWPNPIGDNRKTQNRKQAARPTGLANTFTMAQYGYSHIFVCWQINARLATSFFWQCKSRTESLQFNDPAAAVLCIAYWIDNMMLIFSWHSSSEYPCSGREENYKKT